MPRAQIVGLEAQPARSWKEQRQMLIEHVSRLRNHTHLQKIPIVLVVESNLGFEAAHNARYIMEAGIDNVEIAHEQKLNNKAYVAPSTLNDYATNSVGIRTTNLSKERMYIQMREILEDDTLRVWEHAQPREGTCKEQVGKLVRQMHNYSAVHSDPKLVFAPVRRVFTGKAMGEQDDLLIALMIAMLYRRLFVQAVLADEEQNTRSGL
jgi:hypothetical protein